MATEIPHKWQPVMLVTDRRIECACGSLAIFVVLNRDEDDRDRDTTHTDWGYTAWCQTCWAHAQDDDNDERAG